MFSGFFIFCVIYKLWERRTGISIFLTSSIIRTFDWLVLCFFDVFFVVLSLQTVARLVGGGRVYKEGNQGWVSTNACLYQRLLLDLYGTHTQFLLAVSV